MQTPKDLSYRSAIVKRLDRQTEKGISKYGGTIDKSGHLKSVNESLDYLAEELTDGLVYIEHAKTLVRKLEFDKDKLSEKLYIAISALSLISERCDMSAITAKEALDRIDSK